MSGAAGRAASHEVGPVVLINTFKVAPEDADAVLESWAADTAYLKAKPGFICTQLYRGIAGSGVFVNHADGGVGGCCAQAPNSGFDKLFGGEGDDVLWSADFGNTNADGGPGNDDVYGGPNSDVIIGGAGLDRMWGGAGSDELGTYDGSADLVADCGPDYDLYDHADPV